MQRFSVEVTFTNKEILTVVADHEDAALAKATEIIENRHNVMAVEEASVIDDSELCQRDPIVENCVQRH